MKTHFLAGLCAGLTVLSTAASAGNGAICLGYGPQTPRDISNPAGANTQIFTLAPPPEQMNLCNIHLHAQAEHKGPGFSVFKGAEEDGGYGCNEAAELTEAELTDPTEGAGAFGGVRPGDTIEVHWVYSSCDVQPGPGLGACLSEACANPELRVEAQVFLLVNDPENALDFSDFSYNRQSAGGRPQPYALPQGTGTPVVFAGSTTGPRFSEAVCSPLQVTWSVRPSCAKLDISSLHRWTWANVFEETFAQGVRPLVTAPELLAPIE